MANLSKIVKISQGNYDVLKSKGSITINGKTLTYDTNTLYLVPESGKFYKSYYSEYSSTMSHIDLNDNLALLQVDDIDSGYSSFIKVTKDTIKIDSPNIIINDKTLFELIYPVGSIYMSVQSASPASMFGGTWEQIKDRFLLAAGYTYKAGSTGGEAQHTLTVDEMPSHTHFSNDGWTGFASTNYRIGINNVLTYSKTAGGYTTPYRYGSIDSTLSSTGKNQPHNNMPPYLVVYMWKRTA